MEKVIERIIKEAKAKGACSLTSCVTDMASLVELFYKPQGVEFCIANKFPDMNTFRQLKAYAEPTHGLYVDRGKCVCINSNQNFAIVGKTDATIECNRLGLYHVVLMHGASAKIMASKYSVIRVEKTSDCKVELINIDGTAKFL